MQTIVNSLSNALTLIVNFIPRLIGFLVILLVGWLIATLVSKALTLILRKVGFDRMSERIGLTRFEGRMGVKMDSAGILGKIVYWFILLIFLVPAADALGVPAVSNILNQLVSYIPNVFVAILVLFLGALAGTVVATITDATIGIRGRIVGRCRRVAPLRSTFSEPGSPVSGPCSCGPKWQSLRNRKVGRHKKGRYKTGLLCEYIRSQNRPCFLFLLWSCFD